MGGFLALEIRDFSYKALVGTRKCARTFEKKEVEGIKILKCYRNEM
jgi:hypothetical protein